MEKVPPYHSLLQHGLHGRLVEVSPCTSFCPLQHTLFRCPHLQYWWHTASLLWHWAAMWPWLTMAITGGCWFPFSLRHFPYTSWVLLATEESSSCWVPKVCNSRKFFASACSPWVSFRAFRYINVHSTSNLLWIAPWFIPQTIQWISYQVSQVTSNCTTTHREKNALHCSCPLQ